MPWDGPVSDQVRAPSHIWVLSQQAPPLGVDPSAPASPWFWWAPHTTYWQWSIQILQGLPFLLEILSGICIWLPLCVFRTLQSSVNVDVCRHQYVVIVYISQDCVKLNTVTSSLCKCVCRLFSLMHESWFLYFTLRSTGYTARIGRQCGGAFKQTKSPTRVKKCSSIASWYLFHVSKPAYHTDAWTSLFTTVHSNWALRPTLCVAALAWVRKNVCIHSAAFCMIKLCHLQQSGYNWR